MKTQSLKEKRLGIKALRGTGIGSIQVTAITSCSKTNQQHPKRQKIGQNNPNNLHKYRISNMAVTKDATGWLARQQQAFPTTENRWNPAKTLVIPPIKQRMCKKIKRCLLTGMKAVVVTIIILLAATAVVRRSGRTLNSKEVLLQTNTNVTKTKQTSSEEDTENSSKKKVFLTEAVKASATTTAKALLIASEAAETATRSRLEINAGCKEETKDGCKEETNAECKEEINAGCKLEANARCRLETSVCNWSLIACIIGNKLSPLTAPLTETSGCLIGIIINIGETSPNTTHIIKNRNALKEREIEKGSRFCNENEVSDENTAKDENDSESLKSAEVSDENIAKDEKDSESLKSAEDTEGEDTEGTTDSKTDTSTKLPRQEEPTCQK